MIDQLVRFSLKNKVASFILAGVIVVWGLYAFKHLTIEAFPDPTDTQVQVITLYPGQPTEEVERRVSIPLERALNGTPELFRLRSISLFGLSFVTLTFEDGVEAERARQRVLERLPDAELPDGILPSLGPLATPIGEVYRYTVSGSDPMALRTIQDWTIRPRIMQVPGVADVVSYGGLEYQIQVIPDPAKMASLGVGLDRIFDALEKASGNASGGYVERGSEAFVIRSLGIFNDLEDINAVRVAFNDGVPVRVKDVATVLEGYAPRQGVVTRDFNEDTVEGIILMRRGENPSRVLAALRDKIDDLNERVLPDGVLIEPFYDRTELVNTTLKTVFTNLTEGALLVTLVMFLFTFSLRAALIVAAVIPLSLLTSFLYLHTKGMSANLLSMGAVDFGIIVDGAVIIVEHLFFRLSRDPPQNQKLASKRIAQAVSEVARPTLFSLLIIIAAYIPIFALERVEGRMFGPMAHTVVSALVGALVVSFTLVPVLSLLSMSKRPISPRQSPLVTWSRKLYKPVLSFSLKNPVAIGILAAGAMASALVLMPRLGSEFLPELNEGSLYVDFHSA